MKIDAAALEQYVQSHSHVEPQEGAFEQIASALNAGKHVILFGPPGTGKTSLAEDICRFAAETSAADQRRFAAVW